MSRTTWVELAVFSLLIASARPASAQATPPRASDCTNAHQAALAGIACEIGAALAAAPRPLLVVSAPLKSDTAVIKPAALTARLARVVAGRIGRGARADDTPRDLSQAQHAARFAKALLYLTPELVSGRLRVIADVYATRTNFWDRVANPKPNPLAHAFAVRPADAEIRTFLPTPKLVARRIDRVPLPEGSPVALACGDVGGDGSTDIVFVGRRRILSGRVAGGRFVAELTRDWTALSPVAPSPLREPLGSVVILPDGAVDVAISDRASAFRLSRAGSARPLPQLFPLPGGGCFGRATTGLDTKLVRCAANDIAPIPLGGPPPRGPLDALAGARVTTRDGKVHWVRALRSEADDSVSLSDDTGRTAQLETAGAQLAVGDLDGDGIPEIVASKNTLEPDQDAVDIYSWQRGGSVVKRYELAVPAGVRALAVCPWLGAGISPVVIASSKELMVIR